MNYREQERWIQKEIVRCNDLGEYHEIPELEKELEEVAQEILAQEGG